MVNNTKSIGHNIIISLLLFANTMVRDSRVTEAFVEVLRKQQYNNHDSTTAALPVIRVEPPIYGAVCQMFLTK